MFVLRTIPITNSVRVSSLSYFSARDVELGTLVAVPLRKKEVLAVVVEKESVSDLKSIIKSADYSIRNILHIHKEHLFSPAFLKMAYHVARYNAQPTGIILDTLLPKNVTKEMEFFKRAFVEKKNRTSHRVLILQQNKEERLTYYKTRTRELFSQKQSLVIVCPTIEECILLQEQVSKAIAEKCYVFHGSITARKMKDQFTKLLDETGPVLLITTPGGISFAPDNTGEYIIESSSSSSYRNVVYPYIDKRICIELTAKFSGVSCVYADSVVGVDIWSRVQQREVDIIEPTRKKVIDPKRLEILSYQPKQEKQSEAERIKELQHTKSGFHPLHYKSLEAIETALKEKKNVAIFVPKKGKSPNMVCGDCGKLAVSSSGYPLSLYTQTNPTTKKKENVYVCNATGEKMPAFDVCQFCKGVNLKKMGIATSGVAEVLFKELGGVPITIIDGQHCKTKKAVASAQKSYNSSKGHVFIGTSKLLSVLPDWDIAVVVTLAPLFSRMGYQNEEEVVQLVSLLQEKTKEMMYIQDRKDILTSLPILSTGLHQPFIDEQIGLRKEYHYPPYQRLIQIKVKMKKSNLKAMYQYLLKKFDAYNPSIMVTPHSINYAVLNTMISIDAQSWSVMQQDTRLLSLLENHDRATEVIIDPPTIS